MAETNGKRATAFEALGRISAELANGPLEEHRGPMLAEQIRRAVAEIARPASTEQLEDALVAYICETNPAQIPEITRESIRGILHGERT